MYSRKDKSYLKRLQVGVFQKAWSDRWILASWITENLPCPSSLEVIDALPGDCSLESWEKYGVGCAHWYHDIGSLSCPQEIVKLNYAFDISQRFKVWRAYVYEIRRLSPVFFKTKPALTRTVPSPVQLDLNQETRKILALEPIGLAISYFKMFFFFFFFHSFFYVTVYPG